MNFRKSFVAAAAFALAVSAVPVKAEENQDELFAEFLEEEYKETLEEDYMTLHYSLRDYKSHGIEKPELNIGKVSWDDYESDKKELEDTLAELQKFDYDALSEEHKHDYETYEFYLENLIALNSFPMFDFWFLPSTGVTDNLLTNFTEYVFYEKQDFDDYLEVLATVPEYIDGALDVTKRQAAEGYFMTDGALDETLSGIDKFVEKKDDNQLIIIFDQNVDAFEGLTEKEKEDYKKRNKDIVLNTFIPAYSHAAEELETLRGSRKGGDAVADLPNGKEYYAALVKLKASRDATVDELLDICSQYLKSEVDRLIEVYDADSTPTVSIEEPDQVLSYLQNHLENYPEGPQVQFKVSYLDPSVANPSTVAYYMEPPVDDLVDNVVRINGSNISDSNGLYETMAHEGFPGHLYQITWYLNTNPSLLRTLLNNIGYTEGWAMYSQSEAWTFSGLPEDTAQLYASDTSLSYVLQAAVDLGINGKGWTVEEAGEYLEKNGFNSALASMVYDYVTQDPALLVPYGVGLAQFGLLREKAENTLGDSFDIVDYHRVLLTYGDRPFQIVERDVDAYLNGGTVAVTPAPEEKPEETPGTTAVVNGGGSHTSGTLTIGIAAVAGIALIAFLLLRERKKKNSL